jgi:hypothetical protein
MNNCQKDFLSYCFIVGYLIKTHYIYEFKGIISFGIKKNWYNTGRMLYITPIYKENKNAIFLKKFSFVNL